jgi:hypothetical protein
MSDSVGTPPRKGLQTSNSVDTPFKKENVIQQTQPDSL